VAGFNFYRGREGMFADHSQLLAQRNAEFFLNLKKRFVKS
jgi:hypothetical protein